MVSESGNALKESQRLLREREKNQAAFEERVNDSKKSLARTEELLARLKEIFSRAR
jgi:hypothetical protein